jgi:cytosine deaminase
MAYELIVKIARYQQTLQRLVDYVISRSRILKITPGVCEKAEQVIDAGGKLVTESFINGHLNLFKVNTLTITREEALSSYTNGGMGGTMAAF